MSYLVLKALQTLISSSAELLEMVGSCWELVQSMRSSVGQAGPPNLDLTPVYRLPSTAHSPKRLVTLPSPPFGLAGPHGSSITYQQGAPSHDGPIFLIVFESLIVLILRLHGVSF